jgi:RNA polymerase sigma-70 factor, ECF subfamily
MSRDALRKASIDELIELARARDQDALAELFNRSRPMLKSWAAKQMGDRQRGAAGSSDVAQGTAERAFENFAQFEGSTEGEWNAWLHRIFVRFLAELHRAAGRRKRDDRGTLSLDSPEVEEVPSRGKSPSQKVAHDEAQDQLLTYLFFELPKDQREAIWLHHLQELPVVEVAQKMGKSPGAVGGLLQRGLKTLRSRMNNELGGDAGGEPEEVGAKSEVSAAFMSYLQRCESGEIVDRDAFLTEHAACADELRPLLDAIDHIRAIWDDDPNSEQS